MIPVTVAAGSEVMLRGIFLCALVRPVAVTVSLIMDDISSSVTDVGIGDRDFSQTWLRYRMADFALRASQEFSRQDCSADWRAELLATWQRPKEEEPVSNLAIGYAEQTGRISTGELCICTRALSPLCLDTCLPARCHQWILVRPIRLCQCRSDQEEGHRSPIAGALPMHITLVELVGSWCGWRAHWSPFQADCRGFTIAM